MAKRTYTPQQMSLAAAGCFLFVLFGVLMPWYAVTTPYGTQTANGLDDPFLGVWVLVLSGVGGLLAGAVGAAIVPAATAKPVLGLGAAFYLVAWVLTLVDMFRDLPTYVTPVATAYRQFGVWPTSTGALFGAILVGGAVQALVKAPPMAPPPLAPPPA